MHISKPPFVAVAALLFALLYLLKIELFMDLPLWGLLAPTRFAAWQLTGARQVPGLSIRGCGSSESQHWHEVRVDPEAPAWFLAAYGEAQTPSAKILALAGLQAVSPDQFARLRPHVGLGSRDSIPRYWPRTSGLSAKDALDSLDAGTVLSALKDAYLWPEC